MSKEIFFNWKMNPVNSAEVEALTTQLAQAVNNYETVRVVACPPTIFLNQVAWQKQNQQFGFELGAQDVSTKESGAVTGEISAKMLSASGIKYTLIGHSETRQLHRLSNHDINLKVLQAISNNVIPVICIGFQADPSQTDINHSELSEQIRMALKEIPLDTEFYIAYEPVWAIGTGKTADNKTISQVVDFIRSELMQISLLGSARILYGGSVDDQSIESLLELEKVDGFLVGGASLKPDKFTRMIELAV